MEKLLILFNGPPQSGKDTGSEHFLDILGNLATHLKFSAALKQMTHDLYGLPLGTAFDYFEKVKDQPRDEFYGLTPRQAYINVAEKLIKPVHGKDFFVKKSINEWSKSFYPVAVVSDLGFQFEYDYIREIVPINDIVVIQVTRPGCDFGNDSREFVVSDPSHTFQIINDGSKDKYLEQINNIANDIKARVRTEFV